MLRYIVIACLLIAPAAHAGRPKLIHQTQTIPAPAGYDYFGKPMAIDGDWALIGAVDATATGDPQRYDALLYHFVNGKWTFDRVLVSRLRTTGEPSKDFSSFAMSNGLAAIGSNPTQVFKRTNNTWAEISHPFTAPPGDPDYVEGVLEWDGTTLLAEKSSCSSAVPWGARISTLQTDGSWTPLQRLTGDDNCDLHPESWAISANTVVTGTFPNYPETASPQMRVFRRGGTTWQLTSTVLVGGETDVHGDEIFLNAGTGAGTRVYRNDDSLTLVDRLLTVTDSYGASGFYNLTHSNEVEVRGRDVFRKNVAGKYEHVAQLVTWGNSLLTDFPVISGRRVLSEAVLQGSDSFPVVVYHELPATYTPSPVIATGFTNGTAPFTPVFGSFAVATTPTGNRVYRAASVNGGHLALLNNSNWQEQSIEADINPRTALGNDKWAGLAVRRLDDANYYYVAVRSSGRVALEMVRNGEGTQLREVQLTQKNTNWHIALQVRNTMLRVLVDGVEVIWYVDPTPIPHGSAALLGNGTDVDYDNVVAAQVGQSPIFDLEQYGACNGSLVNGKSYIVTGSGSWSCNGDDNGTSIIQQTQTADIARLVIGGALVDDQDVWSRVRLTAVNGSDRWAGIVARYVDASNYYYVTLRSSNTVSLRKVVNGVTTVLGTASLPVTVNTWYDLRLDAVGNELRAFVDNKQVLQATDASHAAGRTGMLTYKAGAEFSNFISWQP